jgi:hypothetical protein
MLTVYSLTSGDAQQSIIIMSFFQVSEVIMSSKGKVLPITGHEGPEGE